ncbi:hypothetical protein E2C01_090660 [Portunus trituberculatus]|uniref:Uncharacterized protein n=1 Tax=Portunus trituberculatus TaxID=210409 RepID=A0A5B7JQZ6_PORTR|nr:hypothetical protein [Portunus trituberculatus]
MALNWPDKRNPCRRGRLVSCGIAGAKFSAGREWQRGCKRRRAVTAGPGVVGNWRLTCSRKSCASPYSRSHDKGLLISAP